MIASKAKSFVQKLGDALHKGKTVVKTTFLEANKKVQAAIKTLMEYKWIPGTGKAYAIPGGGSVREPGSLKDAYQFMKETGEKIVGGGKGATKPEKLINDLRDYTSKKWNVDGNKIMFDKKGMKHVLERHHSDYWNGSVKAEQSFLNKDLSISDIQNIAGEVISQNRDIIISKGTRGMYQIEGKVDGITYIVGFKNGRIGQLYPK
ncbi:hypothetical protein [Bacillus cereus group sp. BfR-BA-01380]|uniref:hypothetical protein n=1 Tax=Bacillus cereus group sp. BfR-BA-01380 TaxID=2920324 RepID=UPI0037C10578